jgi:hypothetical protein
MTTATLFTSVPAPQNQAGPANPANPIVNTGGLVSHVEFTLVITPSTGWGAAAVNWGPDGVSYPGQFTIYEAPTGTGSTTQGTRIHSIPLEPAASGNDGAQYFKAEMMSLAPGATATLTMTY